MSGIRWYCTTTLIGHLVVVCYLPEGPPVEGERGAPRVIEGEGGSRYTVMYTGCIIPPAPYHCGRLQLSPAGRNISVWQDGIGWGHDPPTIIPVPVLLQSAFLQSVVARMVLKN